MAKQSHSIVAVVFPEGLKSQKETLEKWAAQANMSLSKYALIVLQRHINGEKPLKLV